MTSTPFHHARRLAVGVIGRMPDPVRQLAALSARRRGNRELRGLAPMARARCRLYLGPWNTAGQAYRWARAAETLPGTAAQNLAAQRSSLSPFRYPADHLLTRGGQRGQVRSIHGERVLREATHVVHESGRPVLADFHAGSMLDDLTDLEQAGITTAVLYHGSDLRDLHRHAEIYPFSPYRERWDEYFETLQSIVERNRQDLARFPGRVLVSTPDMQDFVPGAEVLPLVVDVAAFATDSPVLEREVPVVLHAPSNPRLKGTAAIEPVLERLDAEGLLTYRQLEAVPNSQMPGLIAAADIVVDQIVLGNPGVLVAESMAAGRLVMAHLSEEVRKRLPGIPVLEADPDTIEEVLRQVLGDRAAYRELADRGPVWAREHHDGRSAARVLHAWMG